MRKYIIILIVIIIAVGGFFVKRQYDKHKNEEKLVIEAQEHMKNYLKKTIKMYRKFIFQKTTISIRQAELKFQAT